MPQDEGTIPASALVSIIVAIIDAFVDLTPSVRSVFRDTLHQGLKAANEADALDPIIDVGT